MATKKKTGKKQQPVLVRSRDSGVWMGRLVSREGSDVTLTEARKIWRWRGANTTSELALNGCSVEYSRVAAPVDVTVVGVCELITSNEDALASVAKCGWPQ